MYCHFNRGGVDRLVAHARGSHKIRTLYGRDRKPGLWIVVDQGIYLFSNGLPGLTPAASDPHWHNPTHFVVYAEECNAKTMPPEEWEMVKATIFGVGGDRIEYMPLADIDLQLREPINAEFFVVDLKPGWAYGIPYFEVKKRPLSRRPQRRHRPF